MRALSLVKLSYSLKDLRKKFGKGNLKYKDNFLVALVPGSEDIHIFRRNNHDHFLYFGTVNGFQFNASVSADGKKKISYESAAIIDTNGWFVVAVPYLHSSGIWMMRFLDTKTNAHFDVSFENAKSLNFKKERWGVYKLEVGDGETEHSKYLTFETFNKVKGYVVRDGNNVLHYSKLVDGFETSIGFVRIKVVDDYRLKLEDLIGIDNNDDALIVLADQTVVVMKHYRKGYNNLSVDLYDTTEDGQYVELPKIAKVTLKDLSITNINCGDLKPVINSWIDDRKIECVSMAFKAYDDDGEEVDMEIKIEYGRNKMVPSATHKVQKKESKDS